MKRISLIFGWIALPACWLYCIYMGEAFGYGRKLSHELPDWRTIPDLICVMIALYSIFVHLPSYLKEKEKGEGAMVVYKILSVITFGVYSYVRFVMERKKPEQAGTGQPM